MGMSLPAGLEHNAEAGDLGRWTMYDYIECEWRYTLYIHGLFSGICAHTANIGI